MELSNFNVREYKLVDQATGESATILYRPLTQGWRARHLEMSVRLQRAVAASQETLAGLDDDKLSEDAMESLACVQQETAGLVDAFQRELLGSLVVGCKDLTINGEAPSVEALVGVLVDLEEPASMLVSHIVEEGSVSEDAGKD